MGVGGWGLQSHFHIQPNNCVEVVLRCFGVVTIFLFVQVPRNAYIQYLYSVSSLDMNIFDIRIW